MTLDQVHPREYKFQIDGVYHYGSGCSEWVCPSNDLDQVLRALEQHEKDCHRAKVIQMNPPQTGRTGPQRFHPL